jgi:hypothetical protein
MQCHAIGEMLFSAVFLASTSLNNTLSNIICNFFFKNIFPIQMFRGQFEPLLIKKG